MAALDFVFWPAPVRKRPFETHVRAAAAGGFTSLAIASTTYDQARRAGLSVADMKALAADHGLVIRHLDTLTTWAPVSAPSPDGGYDAELNARQHTPVERGLEICAELGLTQILATVGYQQDTVPLSQLIDGFGDLCVRAARLGAWVDLEPMPFLGCPTVAAAWAIVGGAAQENSGILMDSWHFFKAEGQTLDCLADIPGRCFRTLQLSDAPRAQVTGSLMEDTIKHRRWPGRGELPLVEFIRAVQAKGSLAAAGEEVFSLEADAMTPEAAGRTAGETTRAVLRAAGVPV